eukprot:8683540-Pyramimonas_sp.AAC.1
MDILDNEVGPRTPASQDCRLLAIEIAEMESVIQDLNQLLIQFEPDSGKNPAAAVCCTTAVFCISHLTLSHMESEIKSRTSLEGVLLLLNEGQELATLNSAQLRLVYKGIYEQVPRGTSVASMRRKLSKVRRDVVLATIAAVVDEQLAASHQAGGNSERANSHRSASVAGSSPQQNEHTREPYQVRMPSHIAFVPRHAGLNLS